MKDIAINIEVKVPNIFIPTVFLNITITKIANGNVAITLRIFCSLIGKLYIEYLKDPSAEFNSALYLDKNKVLYLFFKTENNIIESLPPSTSSKKSPSY